MPPGRRGAPEPSRLGALIEGRRHGNAAGRGGRDLPLAVAEPGPTQGRGPGPSLRSWPARRGNLVRAAILLAQASRFIDPLGPTFGVRRPGRGPGGSWAPSESGWCGPWGLDPAEADDWRRALPALLAPASKGIWALEARLLFDLQKLWRRL